MTISAAIEAVEINMEIGKLHRNRLSQTEVAWRDAT
jgi:hypothetical protein